MHCEVEVKEAICASRGGGIVRSRGTRFTKSLGALLATHLHDFTADRYLNCVAVQDEVADSTGFLVHGLLSKVTGTG
jgi:hypothetical protein